MFLKVAIVAVVILEFVDDNVPADKLVLLKVAMVAVVRLTFVPINVPADKFVLTRLVTVPDGAFKEPALTVDVTRSVPVVRPVDKFNVPADNVVATKLESVPDTALNVELERLVTTPAALDKLVFNKFVIVAAVVFMESDVRSDMTALLEERLVFNKLITVADVKFELEIDKDPAEKFVVDKLLAVILETKAFPINTLLIVFDVPRAINEPPVIVAPPTTTGTNVLIVCEPRVSPT